MRLILLLTTLLLPLLCYAQENKCTLKPEQAPALRGLRLGMAKDTLWKTFPRAMARAYTDEYGESNIQIGLSDLMGIEEYEGVKYIRIKLLDEKVVKLEVDYGSSYQWRDDNEFTEKLSEMLKLPAKAWKGSSSIKNMFCDGFAIEADTIILADQTFSSKVRLLRLDTAQIIKKRRDEKEEKERKTFRP